MKRDDDNNMAVNIQRKVQSSTTLNRRYVKRPEKRVDFAVPIKRSVKITHFSTPTVENRQVNQGTEAIAAAIPHPKQISANQKLQERKDALNLERTSRQVSAKELKERAIQKALQAAAKQSPQQQEELSKSKIHFGFGRVVLALSCAAAVVFAIMYFVNQSMPDLSLKVTAMQSGIEASYPKFVPRDYDLSSIVSEQGKIVMTFMGADNNSFNLTEEKSSWDSDALLNNYVRSEFGENTAVVREQGLTIYIDGSRATWVNGGILYKIEAKDGSLTKKQLGSIALSL